MDLSGKGPSVRHKLSHLPQSPLLPIVSDREAKKELSFITGFVVAFLPERFSEDFLVSISLSGMGK